MNENRRHNMSLNEISGGVNKDSGKEEWNVHFRKQRKRRVERTLRSPIRYGIEGVPFTFCQGI